MPIMSQMISSGSRAATSTTKSHPPWSATRSMTSLATKLDAVLDRLDHARVERRRHDAAQAGVARVVHVDHGAEEVEHLLGHVDDGGGAPARLEDLGVPARLGDVGVARQRVVARCPLGIDVGQRLGDLGLVEERHRALAPQRLEGALPLVPGPGPELHVGEVDLVGRQDGAWFHAAHPTHLPTLRPCATRSVRPGPRGMVFAKNSDRPPGEVQIAWPFGRRASAGCTLRTQYLTIGDTGAHATLLSCPTWLWGAEHGVNEHGVAIGNERVARPTTPRRPRPR